MTRFSESGATCSLIPYPDLSRPSLALFRTASLLIVSLTSLYMLSHLRSIFTARPAMPYNGPTLKTAIAASQNLPAQSAKDEARFANGCFWGTEVSCLCCAAGEPLCWR